MGDRSPERAQEHRDVLFLDQPFGGGDSCWRIRGVVAVKRLDRPSQDSAGLIDALKREFDAILLALPAVRILSAEDRGDADAHRLRREDWSEGQGAAGQQSDPERHRCLLARTGRLTGESCLIPDRKTTDVPCRHAIVRVVVTAAESPHFRR